MISRASLEFRFISGHATESLRAREAAKEMSKDKRSESFRGVPKALAPHRANQQTNAQRFPSLIQELGAHLKRHF
ncbi:MAG TPA: hypothetical protein VHV51_15615 [Polyangiaceae bacterium]|jgi:hypothetical protein|nr:hypothetical protein [Polyangiaceae bacterium]